jgi:hypothetical protein
MLFEEILISSFLSDLKMTGKVRNDECSESYKGIQL